MLRMDAFNLNGGATNGRTAQPDGDSEAERPLTTKKNYKLTAVGNGQRVEDQHRGKVLFSHERGRWLIWNGKKWDYDKSGEAQRLAKQTVMRIYEEAAQEPNEERRQALAKHAAKSDSDG